jgi:hypothetical protein
MERLKTGKFGLGTMIHSVHMTDDVAQLNRFYEEVFGGLGRNSVRASRVNPGLVAADPADTFGAPYFFTTTTFAGDQFA